VLQFGRAVAVFLHKFIVVLANVDGTVQVVQFQ
jgi:hypothetical protein